MSNLREQIERGKTAYLGQRYPGDLASELLPIAGSDTPASTGRSLRLRPWLIAGTLSSLAAGIAILIGLAHPLWQPVAESIPIEPMVAQGPPADLQVPAMPEMPGDLPIVPEYETFSLPSMPGIPSLMEADASQQDSPTTQENIL